MEPPSGTISDILQETCSSKDVLIPSVAPCGIVVAWHGVMTLAFCSWPKRLAELKKSLNEQVFANTGKEENFGSRWPKITLGAQKDGVPPMDDATWQKVQTICDDLTNDLQALPDITLPRLSFVALGSRNLANIHFRYDFAFQSDTVEKATRAPESIVQSVLDERKDPDYLSKINTPGHRSSHYECIWTEASLVAFVGDKSLLEVLGKFREKVEEVAPGRYMWMPEEALHLTIRALDSR